MKKETYLAGKKLFENSKEMHKKHGALSEECFDAMADYQFWLSKHEDSIFKILELHFDSDSFSE